MRLSPSDARGYSLLANIKLAQGKKEDADRLFEKALKTAPTERSALAHVLESAMQAGDVDRALDVLDVLLRRWPDVFPKVAPLLDILARDPAGSVLLASRLKTKPPWRSLVIFRLLKEGAGRALVQKLLVQARASGQAVNHSEIAALIRAYLSSGDILTAYRSFVLTLSATERQQLGYVFDPDFRLKSGSRPFVWHIGKTADVEISYPWYGGGGKGGLSIQFRDAPTRLGNITQILALPPGNYTLNIKVTARSLAAPKGLFWDLVCAGKGGRRIRVSIPDGVYKEKTLSGAFTIPQECASQKLVLNTGVRTASWSARYQGEAIFHEVAVERREQGEGK